MKRVFLVALLLIGCAEAVPEASGKNPIVLIKTSKGDIKVELFQDKAPITVKNFLQYVEDKHYDGTVFHRVIEDFMIQGGGFQKGMANIKSVEELEKSQKKTRKPIKNEAGNKVSNARGTIAMARTGDPDSATAQFFINVDDNSRLDRSSETREGAGYCVFGKVIDGMKVVDDIRKVKTKILRDRDGGGLLRDVPETDVVIESIRKVE